MIPSEVLELFDAEMRRDPPVDPGTVLDRSGGLVRVVADSSWISYWTLTSQTVQAAVERLAAEFRRRGTEVEWKVFGHDVPKELPQLLAAAGFVADPTETFMALDLRAVQSLEAAPKGVQVEQVRDPSGIQEAVAISRRAFAPEPGWDAEAYLRRIADPTFSVFLARVQGTAVAAGRIELPMGRSFASMWGGGTLPEFRGRGAYRALVDARANLARGRGYRYLTVDALESSRPILERVGFQPLTSVVGWVLRP